MSEVAKSFNVGNKEDGAGDGSGAALTGSAASDGAVENKGASGLVWAKLGFAVSGSSSTVTGLGPLSSSSESLRVTRSLSFCFALAAR